MDTPAFTHLHVHSHYSLLDGAVTIDDLVGEAARLGMGSLALTDHGNLFGAIEFYDKARKAGVNPIIGCEAYLVDGDATAPHQPGLKRDRYHVTLLARDRTGYENLCRLSSLSWLKGFHRKPCLDRNMLGEHAEGLMALSGCLSGEVPRHLLAGRIDDAVRTAEEYAALLGRENFYLEVMSNGLQPQRVVREAMPEVARRAGLKLVATNDVHYRCQGDSVAQDAMICIGSGQRMHDGNRRFRIDTNELYFRTSEEMAALFGADSEAYRSTAEIAERCDIRLDLGAMHLPRFAVPTGEPEDAFLRRLCDDGLRRRYGEIGAEVAARFEKEFEVITKMGFVSYFLIVWDLIRFAREQGIPVGPGRGSAAGSIVAYSLGITELDPLRYGLLFERFLNADRISMPDIDIDFCRDRREDVIEYARRRYGSDNVCQIVTFGTMAAKAAIRDAGRVLDIPLAEVDRIAKRIPEGQQKTSLADALARDEELAAMLEQRQDLAELRDVSMRLEGMCRNTSTHAAGVVITDRPLIDLVPLCVVQGQVNTQFQMTDLERIGLLKMDFLGLKNLTILERARQMVRNTRGIDVDYDQVPLDDGATYELLQRADCSGVFQLESSGMRELIVRLKPSCFEDIIALIALYRPGPLQSGMTDSFVQRKHGIERVDHAHPLMEEVLADTYGTMVYQEQVMLVAQRLGGLSLNDADGLRKAMGKKKQEIMESYKAQFLGGCAERRIPAPTAEKVWDDMSRFAQYGFNKSHSAAYGLITYRTAYMKANFPGEFMAALMSCDANNSDKLAAYVEEARRAGRVVLAPDVNASRDDFVLEEEAIRFGFNAIKGVGSRTVEAILLGRQAAGGRFAGVADFIDHVDHRALNRAAFDALVKAGCFDSIETNRAALIASSESLLREAARLQGDKAMGQSSLFGGQAAQVRLEAAPVPAEADVVAMEKEALGLCLSADPMERWRELLRLLATHPIDALRDLGERAEVIVGGIVTSLRTTVSSKGRSAGKRMAMLRIQGAGGSCQAVVFPRAWERHRDLLAEDQVALFRGKVDLSRDEPALLVDEILDLADPAVAGSRRLILDVPATRGEEARRRLSELQPLLAGHPGPTETYVAVETAPGRRSTWRLPNGHRVAVSVELIHELGAVLGPERIHLR